MNVMKRHMLAILAAVLVACAIIVANSCYVRTASITTIFLMENRM